MTTPGALFGFTGALYAGTLFGFGFTGPGPFGIFRGIAAAAVGGETFGFIRAGTFEGGAAA
jgi:hypothetical protein